MGVRGQLGFVLVMTMLLVAGPALSRGKWSQLKPIPQGEEEVYGTAAGGKMYVLGGLGAVPGLEPKMMLWSSIRRRPSGSGSPRSPKASTTRASRRSAASFTRSAASRSRGRPAAGYRPGYLRIRCGSTTPRPTAGRRARPPDTSRGAVGHGRSDQDLRVGGARNPSYSTPELRPSVPVGERGHERVYDTETNT